MPNYLLVDFQKVFFFDEVIGQRLKVTDTLEC